MRIFVNADGSHRPYTAAENAEQDTLDALDAEQSARLDDITSRVARIEAKLWPPAPETTPADPATVTTWPGILYPGQTYRDIDGAVVRNITTVPITTPRSAMPNGGKPWDGQLWQVVTTTQPPTNSTAWRVGATYKAGDIVTYNGKTYRVLQAHTSQIGWEPFNVPALFVTT